MIAVYPDACRIPDDTFGQLPLHIACNFRAIGEVLKCILDSFPEAVRLTDTVEKRLPLHYACLDGYPNDVSMLIAAEKRALTARDANGKTPVDLCQESTSPHRGSILKRIYEISKGYDASQTKTKRRKDKGQQAHVTPAFDQTSELRIESPSEITVETSNASKKSNGKTKSMLPSWAHGRKDKPDSNVPEKRGSSLETPRSRAVPRGKKTRGSSLERLRNRRKSFEKHSRSFEETSSLLCKFEAKPSLADSSNSSKSRKKKHRSRDAVADIASSYGVILAPNRVVALEGKKKWRCP